ncbi:hypothetical protein ACYPKM_01155 [Pseudomonas aeruginosa]
MLDGPTEMWFADFQAKMLWGRWMNGVQSKLDDEEQIIAALFGSRIDIAFVLALATGETALAEKIWQAHGPFKLELGEEEHDDSNGERSIGLSITSVRGKAIIDPGELDDPLRWLSVSGDPVRHFELLIKSGANGLIGLGTEIDILGRQFGDDRGGNLRKQTCNSAAGFDLPVFGSGLVSSAELLEVLGELGGRLAPEWYEPVLCWASEEMIEKFSQDLHPFDPFEEVTITERGWEDLATEVVEARQRRPLSWLTDEELSVTDMPKLDVMFRNLSAESKRGRAYLTSDKYMRRLKSLDFGVNADRQLDAMDYLVLQSFATDFMKNGFAQKPGYRLCRSTASFLRSLPADGLSPVKLEQTRNHLAQYVPVQVILAGGFSNPREPFLRGVDAIPAQFRTSLTMEKLVEAIGKESAECEISRRLSPAFVQRLVENEFEWCTSLSAARVLSEKFGADMSGLVVSLSDYHIRKIQPRDFIPAGAKVRIYKLQSPDLYGEYCDKICGLAQGEFELEGVSSMAPVEELWRLGRTLSRETKPDTQVVSRAIMRKRGIEDFAHLVVTPDDCSLALAIFEADDIRKHRAKLPRAMTARLGSAVLSL